MKPNCASYTYFLRNKLLRPGKKMIDLAAILALYLFSTFNAHSQLSCGTPHTNSTTDYSVPNARIASCSSIKYVSVNIHFMLKSDGTGNFTESDDGMGKKENNGYWYAESMLNYANIALSNNSKMNLPIGNYTPNPPINIRYVLRGVHFHRDDMNYNYDHNFYLHDIYGVNKDTEINVYLQHSASRGTGGVATAVGPSSRNAIKVLPAWTDYKLGGGPWVLAGIFNHEMGHVFGLRHTWEGDSCDDTPNNPNCWNVREPNIDECEVPSNNVMDYNASKNAWTPCQISIAHKHLAGGLASYTTCCPSLPATAIFNMPSSIYIGEKIFLDGSFRWNKPEQGYTIEIYETDKVGSNTNLGNRWLQSFSGSYGKIDLTNLYRFHSLKTYRVRLTVSGNCGNFDEEVKYVTVLNSFLVNNSGEEFITVCDDKPILLNGYQASQHSQYRLLLQESDQSGHGIGVEIDATFTNPIPSTFSISWWTKDKRFPLMPGKYYRLQLWLYEVNSPGIVKAILTKILYVTPCTWNLFSSNQGLIGGWNLSATDQKLIGDFDGDGAEELLLIQSKNVGNTWASVLKYINHQWTRIYSNNGSGWIHGWKINPDDKYAVGDFDNDGKDEIISINPNGWCMVLDFDNNVFKLQWHNGGNRSIGGWSLGSPTKIYSGDFDGNPADKELLTIYDQGGNTSAMIQNYQQGGTWSTISTNNNSGWISGWKINQGDRFVVGDLDGNGKSNDVMVASTGTWSAVLSFNSSTNTWSMPWHNSGSGRTGAWGNIMNTDFYIVGNIDGDLQDEVLFAQSGPHGAWAFTQTFTSNFSRINTNWGTNGDPAQIGGWPLYTDDGTKVDYHFIRPVANQPKKLIAFRARYNDNYVAVYEILGAKNMRVNTPSSDGSVAEINEEIKSFKLYPNPAVNGLFKVEIPLVEGSVYTLTISDLMGKTVKNQKIDQRTVEVKMPSDAKGTFIMNIFKDNMLYKVSRVVVE